MQASLGPFITCFLTVILLSVYIWYGIYIRKNVPYSSIQFTFLAMLLISIRMIVPYNFPFTVTIVSYSLLPPLSRTLFHYIGNQGFGIAEILFYGWMAGVMVNLFRLSIGQWKYHCYLAPFCVRDLSKYPRLAELMQRYGGEKIRVCIIPMELSAGIVNLIRPVLILPQTILEDADLDFIIQHEIEHYRNFDLWLKLLLELVLCVQWFNLAAYFFRDKLMLLFELSNDEKVVAGRSEEERLDYTSCLVKMAGRRKQYIPSYGLSFISRKESDVSVRVKRLLALEKNKKEKHFVLKILQYTFVVLVLICSFVFVPEAYDTVEADTEESVLLTPENAYFVKTEQGYGLFVEDEYWITLAHIPEELTELVVFEEEDVHNEKENPTAGMFRDDDGNDGSDIAVVSG